MSYLKMLFQKFFDYYHGNPFIAAIAPLLILISFSFPVGSIIRYVLVALAFGLFCGQSFRVRERYGEETQKKCYPFVSFIPLVLLLAFLLTGAVYYFILIAAGIVFLYDIARVYVMEKRITKEDEDDDPGSFEKP
ncbi:hypothetical protein [Anaeromassilibacillus senegalensis]|uniref:hypothetical protein n=1 Tax=Anaeromassilibacillus senegalensis TaxID=1673717 RepID=UPI0006828A63|nr:hypothetical protein [Anaeromassilibacillus senegalensis]